MADSSSLEVETDVSASGLSRVRIGQPCEIALDAVPDTRFRGTVSRIAPTVDRAKTTVVTRIRFDALDSRVLPEMSAKVSFLSQALTAEQQKPLIAVHPDALAPRDGTVVFVVGTEKSSRSTSRWDSRSAS
jgi:multidrug efflux pump subunit AcrA (membrane-fusion protein)